MKKRKNDLTMGKELSLDDLNNVNGGSVYHNCYTTYDDYTPIKIDNWEVQDINGNVIQTFGTKQEACNYANKNSLGSDEISWSEVCRRRGTIQ